MEEQLTVMPEMDPVSITGIKRVRLENGLVRLYVFVTRLRVIPIEGTLEGLPVWHEVVAIYDCCEDTIDGIAHAQHNGADKGDYAELH